MTDYVWLNFVIIYSIPSNMAIVRCQDYPPRTHSYETAVKPVGYPDTALICGRDEEGHSEIGWVYLLPEGYEAYQDGKRVFELWGPESSSSAAKVRVSDNVIKGWGIGSMTKNRNLVHRFNPNQASTVTTEMGRYNFAAAAHGEVVVCGACRLAYPSDSPTNGTVDEWILIV